MNILYRLQQLDKGNIKKICSQMGIKNYGKHNKAQLITRLLLPLQTYKMKTKNPKKPKKKTVVRSRKYYENKRMEELVERLKRLNIDKSIKKQPYIPTEEQQKRILELMKK
jgi:hypothetical protein